MKKFQIKTSHIFVQKNKGIMILKISRLWCLLKWLNFKGITTWYLTTKNTFFLHLGHSVRIFFQVLLVIWVAVLLDLFHGIGIEVNMSPPISASAGWMHSIMR